jgi:hypothetical protein
MSEVTAGDIDQALNALDLRRTETLSRHAQEIDALRTEEAELEQFEQTLAAFAAKCKPSKLSDREIEM